MEITYKLNQNIYNAIHAQFSDQRDIDIITFTLEQALSAQTQIVVDTFNKNIQRIVYEVYIELKKDFATKSDLEASIAKLESRITQEVASIKERLVKNEGKIQVVSEQISELKQDIAGVRTEIKEIRNRIQARDQRYFSTRTR